MVQWLVEIGMYLIGLVLIFVGAVALLGWGLFGDRSKRRARCPKCWYDMRGRRPGREGLVCPECGHDARVERHLYKNHRRWRAIVLGLLLGFVSGYPLTVVAGWYREQWAIEAIKEAGGHCNGRQHAHRCVGPSWLVGRLPARFATFFDRILWVDLWGEPEAASALVHVKCLRHLTNLWLAGSDVTDADLSHLEGMTSLQMINLSGTRVTDAGLAHVKGLNNVEWLFLSRTRVTDAGRMALKQALPNLRFDADYRRRK